MIRRNLSLLAVLLVAFGCAQDKVMKIGAVLPLTGEGAIYGRPVNRGVELAFEQLEAREDFPYPVELVVVDSESNPEKAKELLDLWTKWDKQMKINVATKKLSVES